jgi:flagellin-like hook-associated protein FlgL
MAQVLSRLSQTQTQLQASYQLLAGLQALSLTKFLPAG